MTIEEEVLGGPTMVTWFISWFMDDETLKKNKEKYKERLRGWWKKTAGQRRPEDVSRMEAEIKRDRERLFAVCRERSDGVELADCILRLTENAYAYAHYAGIRRGYLIGVEVGKDGNEEKIIKSYENIWTQRRQKSANLLISTTRHSRTCKIHGAYT